MTDEELKELVASLAVVQRETDRQLRKQLKELGKQIGGLGEKFSGFTKGMALPSTTKILTENFWMEFVTPRVKAFERAAVVDIVHEHAAVRAPVHGNSETIESFLSRSVPNL